MNLADKDRRYVWHPFTQMRDWNAAESLIIARAEGNELIDVDGRRYLDGVSSLWVNVHGHRRQEIDDAVRAQLDRVAHSTLLGLGNVPPIELAARLGRTGTMFACEQEDVAPDLMCLAKGISAGYLPLAATLASDEIYRAFLGEYERKLTFFHGHTYTGNPLACAAGIASLDLFERDRVLETLQPKIARLHARLDA